MTGEKIESHEDQFDGRFRTMSKDYEDRLGLGLKQLIGKVLIDGKRVETLEAKTSSFPSV